MTTIVTSILRSIANISKLMQITSNLCYEITYGYYSKTLLTFEHRGFSQRHAATFYSYKDYLPKYLNSDM